MVLNKKAISPVVATALLLVVAVVAVVGFQSWFTTYQSGVNTKVEQQSNSGSALTIERLESNGVVYVKNTGTEAVSTLSGKIALASTGSLVSNCNKTAVLEDAAASTVTEMNISGDTQCSLTVGTAYNVVITTADGVVSAKMLAR